MRPRMGMAWRSASSSSPTCRRAWSPRVEMARLMERAAPISSRSMSGRRSRTYTWKPRRARYIERSEPTRPAPTTVTRCVWSISCMLFEHPREAVDVEETHVKRSRSGADDVRRTEVADEALRRELVEQLPGLLAEAQREVGTPLLG